MLRYSFELILLLVPAAGFVFYFSKEKKPRFSIFMILYLALLVMLTLFSLGKFIYESSKQPPEWDFLGFWIGGNVAARGENFYQAENHQNIQLPYEPSDDFRREIIDVGFWYPPFTMFLFLPLSLFDLSNAYLIWQIFQFLAAFACIYGVWRLFLREHGLLSLLLVAALFLRLLPVRSSIGFAQTNFLNLLFFLLFWNYSKGVWGGIWLALSVVIKPYMALLYSYPLLKKQWKVLASAIIALAVIALLSLVAFGPDTFMSFFVDGNVSQMPDWIYSETTNQSLLATILRISNQPVQGNPIFNIWFLGISAVMTLVTVVIVMRENSGSESWKILALLFLALIVYPANQEFYSVFLIIPVALLLQMKTGNAAQRIVLFIAISAIYLLSGFNDSYAYMFFANLFAWVLSILLSAGVSMPFRSGAMARQTSDSL